MPEIAVDIELYCAKCGAGICANGTATRKRNYPCFVIDPCEKCLDIADTQGYDRGVSDSV